MNNAILGENGQADLSQNRPDFLRLSGFSHESFVDGPGIRVVVFVQGCNNACEHCHNPESWDINSGEEHTVREVTKMIKDAANAAKRRSLHKANSKKEIQGVTFSGGEPFMQAGALVKLAQAVRRTGMNITAYTGYIYEELRESPDDDVKALLAIVDFLIDGPYVHELRDIGLKFRGSSNQRVIDMNQTRSLGQVVEFE